MSNYVPNYQKKQRILEGREDALRRALARQDSEDRLLTAAEKVRLARIRALRARREKISPADDTYLREQVARIDARIASIEALTAADILAAFRAE